MKWAVTGLLVTGIAAAFSAALLVASMTGSESSNAAAPTEINVLVARQDVPAMAVLEAASIESVRIAVEKAPLGALTDAVQAVGRVTATPLKAGQALTRRALAPEGQGQDLASRLEPGMRAVTISLAHWAGLEGLLYPGSMVDVIASFRMQGGGMESSAVSTTLLQNIPVLAVEDQTVGAEPQDQTAEVEQKPSSLAGAVKRVRGPGKVTLMVDTSQAEALQLAAEFGSITLAMRNPHDRQQVTSEATVLSAGRLAKLADYLQAQVAPTLPPAEASLPVAEAWDQVMATPAAAPASVEPDHWEIQVVRGVTVQTQRVALPAHLTVETR